MNEELSVQGASTETLLATEGAQRNDPKESNESAAPEMDAMVSLLIDQEITDDPPAEEYESLLDQAKKYLSFIFLPPVNDQEDDIGNEEPEAPLLCCECFSLVFDKVVEGLGGVLHVSNIDFIKSSILLVLLSVALQVTYIVWGYLQELLMTTQFEPTPSVPWGRFPSATFCVFCNRLVALVLSSVVVVCRHGATGGFRKPPLRSFSPCALGSSISSFCQYASLHYVSFHEQSLFRSCKIVAVMAVGKLLHGTNYIYEEYVEASLITLGVSVFSFTINQSRAGHAGTDGRIVGYLFLLTYLFCDSFTSQWQEKIYRTYGQRKVDLFQMMLGVNLFGLILTSIYMLCHPGELGATVEFLSQNPVAGKYMMATALVSLFGQIFMFVTIKQFGPEIFVLVMTIRSMLTSVLSALLLGPTLPPTSVCSAALVVGVLYFPIRRNYHSSIHQSESQEYGY